MSQRGSFITEYIYCPKCFEQAQKILVKDDKYLCSQTILSWQDNAAKDLPIIAGKVGGNYEEDELSYFEFELVPMLEKVICCDIRISVFSENSHKFFIARPECPSAFYTPKDI